MCIRDRSPTGQRFFSLSLLRFFPSKLLFIARKQACRYWACVRRSCIEIYKLNLLLLTFEQKMALLLLLLYVCLTKISKKSQNSQNSQNSGSWVQNTKSFSAKKWEVIFSNLLQKWKLNPIYIGYYGFICVMQEVKANLHTNWGCFQIVEFK